MEAVPRLPMIGFELKTSPENAAFGPRLKQYIAAYYGEDPESYQNEIYNLEALRSSAVRTTGDVSGCQTLKKYYCQLHFLKSRFPMEDGQDAAICFTWKDNYSDIQSSVPDIRFELMCILYNIGALHTQLGASDSRVTPEGMKMSCTHFQCAAWAFQQIKEVYYQMVAFHSTLEIIHFMNQVALAQAQECILEKSMMDNRKATIISKVAAQVVDYYRRSLNLLQTNSNDDTAVNDFIGTRIYKEWSKYLSFKVAYHKSIALLFQGQQAEEQQKMGERVAFYQLACEQLDEAKKLASGLKNQQEIAEALAFTSDVVEGKRKAAKNENEFIYHEEVPERSTLQEVKGASLVKGISFNVNDIEVSGPDIFAKLVPMEAHEASSMYSEKKAKFLRNLGEIIEVKDQELGEFMSALQLDILDKMNHATGLPQEIIDRAAALSAKPTVIEDLHDVMTQLINLSTEVETMLNEIQKELNREQENEREYQEQIGKRPASIVATELSREAAKYREAHNRAADSNNTLTRAIQSHVGYLKIMKLSLNQIKDQLPSIDLPNDNVDESKLKELEKILGKVDEMRSQRATLWAQLRDAVHKDDITSVVVTKQPHQSLDDIFDQELLKHKHMAGIIEQNCSAQDNIIQALTVTYADLSSTRRYIQETIEKRGAFIKALIYTCDTYDDLTNKVTKGIEFYNKLENNVSKLLQRIKSACKVQQEEREQLLAKSNVLTAPEVTEPISVAPKLKDYLDTRKPRVSLQDVSSLPDPKELPTNQPTLPCATNVVPIDKQSWPPGVRPAPLGSEMNVETTMYDSTTYNQVNQLQQQKFSSNTSGNINLVYPMQYPQASNTCLTDNQYIPPEHSQNMQYSINDSQINQYHQNNPVNNLYSQTNMQYSTGSVQNNQYSYSTTTNMASSQYPTANVMQNTQVSTNMANQYPTATVMPNTQVSGYTGHYQNKNDTANDQELTNRLAALSMSVKGDYSKHYSSDLPDSYMTQYSMPKSEGYSNQYVPPQYNNNHMTHTMTDTVSQQYCLTQPQYNYSASQDYINNKYGNTESTAYDMSTFNQNRYPEVMSVPEQQEQMSLGYQGTNQSSQEYPAHESSYLNYSQSYSPDLGYATQKQPEASYPGQNNTSYYNAGYNWNYPVNQYCTTQTVANYNGGTSTTESGKYAPQSPDCGPEELHMQQPNQVQPPQQVNYGNSDIHHSQQTYETANLDHSQTYPTPDVALNQPPVVQGTNYTGYGVADYNYQVPNSTQQIPYYMEPNIQTIQQNVPQNQVSSMSPYTPYEVGLPQETPASSQSTLATVTKSQPVQKESYVDLLSDLDFSVSQQPLVPQQHVTEDKATEQQKEEKTIITSAVPTEKVTSKEDTTKEDTTTKAPKKMIVTKKPFDNADVKKLFSQEVEKFEKSIEVLGNKTLSGPTNLDLRWKEIQDKQDSEGHKKIISVARCYPLKNRSPDILPYDHSRVELKSMSDDYINASYVKDVSIYAPTFIVTQAPLPNTVVDFWTMVYEKHVELIACLLSDSEMGNDIYWPQERDRDLTVTNFVLTVKNIVVKPNWTERYISLSLLKKRESRMIIHLQFTTWPGSIFPTNPDPFNGYIKEVLSMHQQQRSVDHPVVVHCSSGIGRSGLLCLLSIAVLEVTNNPVCIPDLISLTNKLSLCRKNILRDREHLKFAHEAFHCYMKSTLASDEKKKKLNEITADGPSETSTSTISLTEEKYDPLNSLDPFWASKRKVDE